jgi:acetyl-CoA hydrolase
MPLPFPVLTPEEAAVHIQDGQTIGFSGFTPAGSAKAIPPAIARKAEAEHEAGRPFKVGVLTGASTGDSLDGALARARAVSFRAPYQSDPTLRKQINNGETRFFDMHLSVMPQMIRYGFLGPIHWAIVEAADLTAGGGIVLTSSVGATPTFLNKADRILIELNRRHPPSLLGMHDIYEPADPPHRSDVPVYGVTDRIGSPIMFVDPKRIVGVVETNLPDETNQFSDATEITQRIGWHVANFLAGEIRCGKIPKAFLPIQSGVGDIANSVLSALGAHPDIPAFQMYTEVLQDSVIPLIRQGRVTFASTCALTLSTKMNDELYGNLEWFRPRMLLRPQEISNHPEVVRRLGIISMNTAIEIDLFGNVNSTHVLGRQMMNGIGGSGDFTRNAYLSIFSCPSTQKGGKISTIVPMVSHVDHSEHSVQVVATEHGVADLRGTSPGERAELIISRCAHPEYRDELRAYVRLAQHQHTPHSLGCVYRMHQKFMDTGDMRGVAWG